MRVRPSPVKMTAVEGNGLLPVELILSVRITPNLMNGLATIKFDFRKIESRANPLTGSKLPAIDFDRAGEKPQQKPER